MSLEYNPPLLAVPGLAFLQGCEQGKSGISHPCTRLPRPAQVVLGTESGMVTAIVRRVQALLRDVARPDIAVEIVFPVASEAITPASPAANGPLAPAPGAGATMLSPVASQATIPASPADGPLAPAIGTGLSLCSLLPAWPSPLQAPLLTALWHPPLAQVRVLKQCLLQLV